MLIKVFCVVQGCVGGGGGGGQQASLLNKGGGEQQASWFNKQQAVEFPQVLTSLHNNVFAHSTVTNDDDQQRPTTMCHDQRAWPIGPN